MMIDYEESKDPAKIRFIDGLAMLPRLSFTDYPLFLFYSHSIMNAPLLTSPPKDLSRNLLAGEQLKE